MDGGATDPGVFTDAERSERLALLMAPGRDRELLAEWFDTATDYGVDVVTTADELPDDYDLCLLDDDALNAHRAALAARKRDASPVYLPHVLLNASDQERVADDVVDDVVSLPVGRAQLYRRVENLLRTRRASLRLAEREAQYHRLVDLTPEAILLLDDGTVTYANDATATMLDIGTAAAIEGRDIREFVAEGDARVLQHLLDEIERGGRGQGAEFVELDFQSATGERVPVGVTGVTVTERGHRLVQLVVRDLTAQKEREQRLRLFQRAIDAASQGITIADATSEDVPLIYANEGFERITGYDVSEVIGRNCRFLQGRNTASQTVDEIRDAIANDEPVSVEILNYRRDGTPFWNQLDIVPIRDDDGTVTHYLGLQQDVTQRKRRELRLSVLNRVLRHNFRNKMTVISGYAERIEAGESPSSDAAKIRRAADELLEIGTQMYEFDALVADESENTDTINIVDLLQEELATLCEHAPEATVDADLPDRAPVAGHPSLRAALRGFFSLFEDGAMLDVVVERTEGDVHVIVTDRGDALRDHDVDVVANEAETPLEHLDRLELWLLRWAVEQSGGEFDALIEDSHPTIRLHLNGTPITE